MKARILFIAPTPPPYAGPEICSQLFLDSRLSERYSIRHLRSNVSGTNSDKGRLGIRKAVTCIPFFIKLASCLTLDRPQLVYSLLAQNKAGFIRDAVIIMLCRLFRRKVVVHLHGGNFANFYATSSPIFKKFVRSVLSSVDILILLAERLREQVASIFPEKNIRVLYNAVNVREFREVIKQPQNHHVSVLYVGHLSYAKGFYDLLKAIPLVLEEQPHTQFMFAGERIDDEKNILYDENGDGLEFQDIDEALNDVTSMFPTQVKPLGVISGQAKIETYANADIFVLPSYSEGLPLVVLEAMAARLPIVTTPVGALPEIFSDKTNGFFVNPGDHRQLADRLIRLTEDADLRAEIGQRNSEYAMADFDIDVIAQKLSDIFDDVLKAYPKIVG